MTGSDLLENLEEDSRDLLAQYLEEVKFKSGHVIVDPGTVVRYAYFPRHHALAAYLVPMADGRDHRMRDGRPGRRRRRDHQPAGIAVLRALLRPAGRRFLQGFRCPALDQLRSRSVEIDSLLKRYADCLIAQLFQTIACNARHNIEQRTARWLCAVMNRTGDSNISLTQSQLGGFLGVGRSYLAQILSRLKAQGILDTRRGGVVIRQPRKLRGLSCECNAVIADHCKLVMSRS